MYIKQFIPKGHDPRSRPRACFFVADTSKYLSPLRSISGVFKCNRYTCGLAVFLSFSAFSTIPPEDIDPALDPAPKIEESKATDLVRENLNLINALSSPYSNVRKMAKANLLDKIVSFKERTGFVLDHEKLSNKEQFPLEVQTALFESMFFFVTQVGYRYGSPSARDILIKLGKNDVIEPALELMLLEHAILVTNMGRSQLPSHLFRKHAGISILNSIGFLDHATQTKALQELKESASTPRGGTTREVIERIMEKTILSRQAEIFLVDLFFHPNVAIHDSAYRILTSEYKLYLDTLIKMTEELFKPYIEAINTKDSVKEPTEAKFLRGHFMPLLTIDGRLMYAPPVDRLGGFSLREERVVKWLIKQLKRQNGQDRSKIHLLLVNSMEQVRLSAQGDTINKSEAHKKKHIDKVELMATHILKSQMSSFKTDSLPIGVQVRLAHYFAQYPSSMVADVLLKIPNLGELAKRELLPMIENTEHREIVTKILIPKTQRNWMAKCAHAFYKLF